MATNPKIKPDFADHILRVRSKPTKQAAVPHALQNFIARREQWRVAELFGKLEWEASFDYKVERARRR
jgi:hypothetical protein